MTAIAGYGGSVKLGSNSVAEIDKWDLSVDSDIYDTTAFSSAWKTQIAGLRKWSGTFGGRFYSGDTNGQAMLQTAILTGVTVTLNFYINGTNYYAGTAFIKQISIKTAVNATVDASFSFEGTGSISFT